MYDDYSQSEKSIGIICVNGKEVGPAYYEFTYNPLQTDKMQIFLLNPPLSVAEFLKDETKDISIISKNQFEQHLIRLNEKLFSFSTNGKTATFTCPVDEFIIDRTSNDFEDESYIKIVFDFPLTSLTNTFHSEINHSDYGVIRGTCNFETDEISLEKDDFFIDTEHGKFKIVGSYSSLNLPSTELYSFKKILRSSNCSIKIPYESESCRNKVNAILDYAELIFTLISFLERDRICWTAKFICMNDSASKLYTATQTYRWHSPVSKNYHKEPRDNQKRRHSLILLVEGFEKLESQEKPLIKELMKNIEISNCASTIETKLIHFHSCMDFFRKKYNKKCSNFSKDLIDLLDTNEIAIDDLVPKQQIDDIRNKKSRNSAFKFTQLRNGYLHDGFEVFEGDYKAVVKEVDIMRCICERFILKRMGINHEDTILGSF